MLIKTTDYIIPIVSFFCFLAYSFILAPLIGNCGKENKGLNFNIAILVKDLVEMLKFMPKWCGGTFC